MYFQTSACEAEETREVGISDADFTVDKPRRCISVLIFLPFNAQDGLLKKKKKGLLDCCVHFSPSWYSLEVFSSGIYIYSFARYRQLPSTEDILIYVSTCSMLLSIFARCPLYYKCLFTFIWSFCFQSESFWQKWYLTHAHAHSVLLLLTIGLVAPSVWLYNVCH